MLTLVAQGDRSTFDENYIVGKTRDAFRIGDRGEFRINVVSETIAGVGKALAEKFYDKPNVTVSQSGSEIVVSFINSEPAGAGSFGPGIAVALPFIVTAVVGIVLGIAKLLIVAWAIYKLVEVVVDAVTSALKDNPMLVLGLIGGMLVLALSMSEQSSSTRPQVIVIGGRNAY